MEDLPRNSTQDVLPIEEWMMSSSRMLLQVVPLRIGGGTRLKIVESLGMCCPVCLRVRVY